MATRHPRLLITIKPEVRQLLLRLAALNHKTLSRTAGELLEEFEPVLEKMVVVLEAARKAEHQVSGELRRQIEKAEAVVGSHAAAAVGQFDWLLNAMNAQHGQGGPPEGAQASVARGAPPASRERGKTAVRASRKPKRAK